MGYFFCTKKRERELMKSAADFQHQLTQEQIKNGKLRKAIHDAKAVMEKAAPVEEGK